MQTNDFTIEKLSNGNYVVKTTGIYQDIDFINGGFITTEQRAEEIRDLIIKQNTPTLDGVKQSKINELNQACQNAIVGGFTSTAYQNVSKTYGSTLEDQANITGNALSAVSKISGVPECKDDKFYYHAQGEDFSEWTADECLQLARDFKSFKEQVLFKNKQLQAYVNTLTTVEEVQKVSWDTVITSQS